MGISRTDLFTQEQNLFAKVAKALAHPARIAIIEHLAKSKVCVNGHLVEELGLAQATISQHLRELKEVGLIQGTIEGRSLSYCIHPENWKKIQSKFNGFFEDVNCCCGDSNCN